MAGRQHAARHSVDGCRQVRGFHEAAQLVLRMSPPDRATRDDGGALRVADEAGHAPDRIRVGRRPGVGCEVLGGLGKVGRAEENVYRNVHEHRSCAAAQRRPHELEHARERVLGRFERHRLFGQRLHHRDVIHLLERAHPPARDGRAAAEHEHRAVAGLRLGQRGHRVGDARPGGDRGHSALARHLGPTLGREGGRLLVAHIDDANAVLGRAGEDRPDVAAVQCEEVAGAGALERQSDELACVARVSQRAWPTAWREC